MSSAGCRWGSRTIALHTAPVPSLRPNGNCICRSRGPAAPCDGAPTVRCSTPSRIPFERSEGWDCRRDRGDSDGRSPSRRRAPCSREAAPLLPALRSTRRSPRSTRPTHHCLEALRGFRNAAARCVTLAARASGLTAFRGRMGAEKGGRSAEPLPASADQAPSEYGDTHRTRSNAHPAR